MIIVMLAREAGEEGHNSRNWLLLLLLPAGVAHLMCWNLVVLAFRELLCFPFSTQCPVIVQWLTCIAQHYKL
jgi:hypothetical protein